MTTFILLLFLAAAAPDDLARSHYENQVRQRIEAVWHKPAGAEDLKVEIAIQLDRAGRVIASNVTTPSGSEELDASLLRAVRAASPYPPLPEAVWTSGGEFKFAFPTPPAPPPEEIKPLPPLRPLPRAPAPKPSPKTPPGVRI